MDKAFEAERCPKAISQQALTSVLVPCANRVAGIQAVAMAHADATVDCTLIEAILVCVPPAVSRN
jgi:hypothetical protein